MAVNEVKKSNGDVIISLRNDDVTADDVVSGKKFHLPNGTQGTGNADYVVKSNSTTGSTAYGRVDGTESNLVISADATADTLALRSSTGTLKVATPTKSTDATTKLYVDNAVTSNTRDYIGYFATKADLLAYSGTKNYLDWAIVGADESHSNQCWRYIVSNSLTWTPYCKISDSNLTEEQYAMLTFEVIDVSDIALEKLTEAFNSEANFTLRSVSAYVYGRKFMCLNFNSEINSAINQGKSRRIAYTPELFKPKVGCCGTSGSGHPVSFGADEIWFTALTSWPAGRGNCNASLNYVLANTYVPPTE